ncbi:hypothetical protein C8R45DRAFT_928005 [Mycena sanguinolenta]|nr:hypothetical protein C8R45DRAFT_928005 [Mycena sanguinolenta]
MRRLNVGLLDGGHGRWCPSAFNTSGNYQTSDSTAEDNERHRRKRECDVVPLDSAALRLRESRSRKAESGLGAKAFEREPNLNAGSCSGPVRIPATWIEPQRALGIGEELPQLSVFGYPSAIEVQIDRKIVLRPLSSLSEANPFQRSNLDERTTTRGSSSPGKLSQESRVPTDCIHSQTAESGRLERGECKHTQMELEAVQNASLSNSKQKAQYPLHVKAASNIHI